ncbi:MraY family glycosyltransferase [Pedobacter sp. GR22-6]|uniref:MraY family glycosyltransferase n=1 Tax=Pedobacter sp. GR22-6 TaxID=3127957 RepID=UPI00307E79AB
MLYISLIIFLFLAMLLYFKVADHFNIIDKPNERSSHSEVTIRGGGIIFLIAASIAFVFYPKYWILSLGMLAIGIISFIDDRITLSNKIRLFVHLFAVTLLFISLSAFQFFSPYVITLLYVFVIGTINAYNFMDGINGITGVYSFVVLGGLQYVNLNIIKFVEPDMIWLPIIAVSVFLYFNFRKRAKCFAGDVGSITIAFWILFLLIKLIMQTGNYGYILFLAVYGVDAVLTIVHRLILKQNIFQAHRFHFYQILANEQKQSHLLISSVYGAIQVLIVAIVTQFSLRFVPLFLIIITPLALIYIFFKPKLMKAKS